MLNRHPTIHVLSIHRAMRIDSALSGEVRDHKWVGWCVPKKRSTHRKPDRLITELERFEVRLQEWTSSSPANLRLFRKDPLRAMQAAGLDVEDDIMLELQFVTAAIARKLK